MHNPWDVMDDHTYCTKCNCWLSEKDSIEYDGNYYCESCLEKIDAFCAQCGKISNAITTQPSEDETLCDECIAKLEIEE